MENNSKSGLETRYLGAKRNSRCSVVKLLGNKPIRIISRKCRVPLDSFHRPAKSNCTWNVLYPGVFKQTLITQKRLSPLLQRMVPIFVILRRRGTWQISVQSNSRALKLFLLYLDSQSFLISDVLTSTSS